MQIDANRISIRGGMPWLRTDSVRAFTTQSMEWKEFKLGQVVAGTVIEEMTTGNHPAVKIDIGNGMTGILRNSYGVQAHDEIHVRIAEIRRRLSSNKEDLLEVQIELQRSTYPAGWPAPEPVVAVPLEQCRAYDGLYVSGSYEMTGRANFRNLNRSDYFRAVVPGRLLMPSARALIRQTQKEGYGAVVRLVPFETIFPGYSEWFRDHGIRNDIPTHFDRSLIEVLPAILEALKSGRLFNAGDLYWSAVMIDPIRYQQIAREGFLSGCFSTACYLPIGEGVDFKAEGLIYGKSGWLEALAARQGKDHPIPFRLSMKPVVGDELDYSQWTVLTLLEAMLHQTLLVVPA